MKSLLPLLASGRNRRKFRKKLLKDDFFIGGEEKWKKKEWRLSSFSTLKCWKKMPFIVKIYFSIFFLPPIRRQFCAKREDFKLFFSWMPYASLSLFYFPPKSSPVPKKNRARMPPTIFFLPFCERPRWCKQLDGCARGKGFDNFFDNIPTKN